MDFNIQKLVCVYLHLCEYIFNKRKKPTLLRNLTTEFLRVAKNQEFN